MSGRTNLLIVAAIDDLREPAASSSDLILGARTISAGFGSEREDLNC
jgi:hypothetical protein